MPAFLIPLIEKCLEWGAPVFIHWGLAALEKKYPGLRLPLQTIIGYIDAAKDQPQATQNVQSQIEKLTMMPVPDLKS